MDTEELNAAKLAFLSFKEPLATNSCGRSVAPTALLYMGN